MQPVQPPCSTRSPTPRVIRTRPLTSFLRLVPCTSVLYRSVHERIFSLPNDSTVYPAHDYKGRMSTSVGEEKAHNPRLTKVRKHGVSTSSVELAWTVHNLQC